MLRTLGKNEIDIHFEPETGYRELHIHMMGDGATDLALGLSTARYGRRGEVFRCSPNFGCPLWDRVIRALAVLGIGRKGSLEWR